MNGFFCVTTVRGAGRLGVNEEKGGVYKFAGAAERTLDAIKGRAQNTSCVTSSRLALAQYEIGSDCLEYLQYSADPDRFKFRIISKQK